jgi:hypothetical protein
VWTSRYFDKSDRLDFKIEKKIENEIEQTRTQQKFKRSKKETNYICVMNCFCITEL